MPSFLLGSPGWLIAPSHMLNGVVLELRAAAFGHLGISGVPLLGQIRAAAGFITISLHHGRFWVGDRQSPRFDR